LFFPNNETSSLPQYGHSTLTTAILSPSLFLYFTISSPTFQHRYDITLEADSEMLITILGAFAQVESESISANVRWGKRQAMRDGKAIMQYKKLYAYQKGEDGQPEIIPEQAVVVQRIYDEYLAGASFRMIKNSLEADKIPSINGSAEWTLDVIKGIPNCSLH